MGSCCSNQDDNTPIAPPLYTFKKKRQPREKFPIGNSIYILEDPLLHGRLKIGKTRNLTNRKSGYNTSLPESKILFYQLVLLMDDCEKQIHLYLNPYCIYGNREWYRYKNQKEKDMIVDCVRKLCNRFASITTINNE
jgi:hypothetical protein